VYDSDVIVIVLFNLSESVKFTSALNYVLKNVASYLWLGSKHIGLKHKLCSVVLIGMLKFVILMWNGMFCCQMNSHMLLKLVFFCMINTVKLSYNGIKGTEYFMAL
jgi:hypothetical protein